MSDHFSAERRAIRLDLTAIGDANLRQLKVFKKYSQMKLQMKREALTKLDRSANEKR